MCIIRLQAITPARKCEISHWLLVGRRTYGHVTIKFLGWIDDQIFLLWGSDIKVKFDISFFRPCIWWYSWLYVRHSGCHSLVYYRTKAPGWWVFGKRIHSAGLSDHWEWKGNYGCFQGTHHSAHGRNCEKGQTKKKTYVTIEHYHESHHGILRPQNKTNKWLFSYLNCQRIHEYNFKH